MFTAFNFPEADASGSSGFKLKRVFSFLVTQGEHIVVQGVLLQGCVEIGGLLRPAPGEDFLIMLVKESFISLANYDVRCLQEIVIRVCYAPKREGLTVLILTPT